MAAAADVGALRSLLRLKGRWAAAVRAAAERRDLIAVATGSACRATLRSALRKWRHELRAKMLRQRISESGRNRSRSGDSSIPPRCSFDSGISATTAAAKLHTLGMENAALVDHIERLQGTLRSVWLEAQLRHLDQLEMDLEDDLTEARAAALADDRDGVSSGHLDVAEEVASLVQQLEAVRWQRRALEEELNHETENGNAEEGPDEPQYEAYEPEQTELTYVPFGQALASDESS